MSAFKLLLITETDKGNLCLLQMFYYLHVLLSSYRQTEAALDLTSTSMPNMMLKSSIRPWKGWVSILLKCIAAHFHFTLSLACHTTLTDYCMQHFTTMTINTKNEFFAQLKAFFFLIAAKVCLFIYLAGPCVSHSMKKLYLWKWGTKYKTTVICNIPWFKAEILHIITYWLLDLKSTVVM